MLAGSKLLPSLDERAILNELVSHAKVARLVELEDLLLRVVARLTLELLNGNADVDALVLIQALGDPLVINL